MRTSLNDPTPKSEIKRRQGPRMHSDPCPKYGKCDGQHMMLDYVDARFVMQRLDDSVGPEGWQDRYEDRPDGSVRGGIGVKWGEEWIWKWDVGDPSDIEPAKGAHSEALKRAGVKWGIARDLYGDHAANPTHAPARNAAPTGGSIGSGRPTSTPAASANAATSATSIPAGLPSDEPPWPVQTISDGPLQQALADMPPTPPDEHYGPTCPKHLDRAWKDTGYGLKCTAKDDSGPRGYCQYKPSRRWVAEHELAPA